MTSAADVTDSMPSSTTTTATATHNADIHDDENVSLQQLLSVARIVLLQAVEMLDNQVREDAMLTVHSKLIPGSTIGKHLRHARDHFELLLSAVESSPPHNFSYDTRIRNTPMETLHSAAREALLDTISKLEKLVPEQRSETKMVLEAVTPHLQSFDTSFGRELWFACLHCVHHWSMVRVIAGEQNITLEQDFGFAPSTLVHHERDAPLGKANL